MSKIDSQTWDSFWPLRATVKEAVEAAEREDERLGQEAKEKGDKYEGKVEPVIDAEVHRRWHDMRNHLVANFYFLVLRAADTMSHKIKELEADELSSMGVDGLYDAIDGYGAINPATGQWEGIDPKTGKKVKFETYATYRIKGSILDSIRRDDWVPRLVRSRHKMLKDTRETLEAKLGRMPTTEEIIEDMGVTADQYSELVDEASIRSVQSLNTMFSAKDGGSTTPEEMSILDCICDQNTPEPLDIVVQRELISKLFGKNFTDTEKRIVKHYYWDGCSMKEIADMIGLSESRVSQMNSAIMARVQEKIRRNPEYFGRDAMTQIAAKPKKARMVNSKPKAARKKAAGPSVEAPAAMPEVVEAA